MKSVKIISLVLLTAAVLFGCGTALDNTGSMEISVDNMIGSRMISPPISMEVADYEVTLTGQSSQVVVFDDSAVISNLVPGTYQISVIARNDLGVGIGSGSASNVEVTIGSSTEVTIAITENTAIDGSMSGTLAWQPDILLDPSITGYLKDSAGTQTDLTFVLDIPNCTGTVTEDPLAVGYYTLVNQVRDNGEIAAGFAEILRVISGYETTYSKTLAANQLTGDISIIMDVDMNDPLVLTFDPVPSTLELNDETIDINLTNVDEVGYIAVWYIDGTQVLVDSDTYSLDSSLYLYDTTHRLDCVVFSTDGSRANSASWMFTNTDTPRYTISVLLGAAIGDEYTITLEAMNGGETKVYTGLIAGSTTIECSGILSGEYELKAIGAAGYYKYFDYVTGSCYLESQGSYIPIPNETYTIYNLGSL